MATGATKRSAVSRTGTTRKPAASRSDVKAPQKAAVEKPTVPPRKVAATNPALPEPEVVPALPQAGQEPELRKKELIDLVVEQSCIKKKDAKPVVEAMLDILGNALASGRELNLQPFGKLRINRREERSNGRIIVCKLRQAKPPGEKSQDDEVSAAVPLAEREG